MLRMSQYFFFEGNIEFSLVYRDVCLYSLLCVLSYYIYRYCNGFYCCFLCFCFVFCIPATLALLPLLPFMLLLLLLLLFDNKHIRKPNDKHAFPIIIFQCITIVSNGLYNETSMYVIHTSNHTFT